MATELRLRRGTTDEHGNFIGAEAEATVDTDKNTIVVHDGQTQGGYPLAQESDTAPAVDSVATLRASSFPANLERLWLSGYYGVGTPGGGELYADRADTTTADNGGTVFVDGDGVRWKRSVTEEFMPATWFGLSETEKTAQENSDILEGMLDNGIPTAVPDGEFDFTGIDVRSNSKLIFVGDLRLVGSGNTGLKFGDGSTFTCRWAVVYSPRITLTDTNQTGLSFDGDGTSSGFRNTIINPRIFGEGFNVFADTVGVFVGLSQVNTFWGGQIENVAVGTRGRGNANATYFYGTVIKSNKSQSESDRPFDINGKTGSTRINRWVFDGCNIENWENRGEIQYADVIFQNGYIENFTFQFLDVRFSANVFLYSNNIDAPFIAITGGNSTLTTSGNWWDSTSGNLLIRYESDVDSIVRNSGSDIITGTQEFVNLEEYWDGSTFQPLGYNKGNWKTLTISDGDTHVLERGYISITKDQGAELERFEKFSSTWVSRSITVPDDVISDGKNTRLANNTGSSISPNYLILPLD